MLELIKRDTNGVLQEQSFKPSEGVKKVVIFGVSWLYW